MLYHVDMSILLPERRMCPDACTARIAMQSPDNADLLDSRGASWRKAAISKRYDFYLANMLRLLSQ